VKTLVGDVLLISDDKMEVARMEWAAITDDDDGMVNAEFIVRCVNNHDDLLAALKCLMDRGFTMATESIARRAIAKAEGR